VNTIPLPERCLTCLPPWPQAIRYAGKRCENRGYRVGKPLAEWRYSLGLANVPIVGLSQSKETNNDEVRRQTHDLIDRGLWTLGQDSVTYRSIANQAATLWLVAELLDVLPPDRCEGDEWHVPGQWGLMLGRVWEVKPVACMGGLGAWRSQWCPACKKIIADSHGLTCKRCLSKLVSGPGCPQLEVITEVV
jgi:hypothetical protein